MHDLRAELSRVNTEVHQAYTKCEEVQSAQIDAQISLLLAIAEVSRAHRGGDAHESLKADLVDFHSCSLLQA
jgi:hypothetical protein